MKKATIFSIEHKIDDQRSDEMRMTGEERLELGFRLIDAALAMSPNRKFHPPIDDSIQWIQLKMKDDRHESGSQTV